MNCSRNVPQLLEESTNLERFGELFIYMAQYFCLRSFFLEHVFIAFTNTFIARFERFLLKHFIISHFRRNSTNCDLYSVDASLACFGNDPAGAKYNHQNSRHSSSTIFSSAAPIMPSIIGSNQQKNGVDQKVGFLGLMGSNNEFLYCFIGTVTFKILKQCVLFLIWYLFFRLVYLLFKICDFFKLNDFLVIFIVRYKILFFRPTISSRYSSACKANVWTISAAKCRNWWGKFLLFFFSFNLNLAWILLRF